MWLMTPEGMVTTLLKIEDRLFFVGIRWAKNVWGVNACECLVGWCLLYTHTLHVFIGVYVCIYGHICMKDATSNSMDHRCEPSVYPCFGSDFICQLMLSQVFGKLEGFAWTGRGMFPATAQHVEVSFHVGNLQLPRPGWWFWWFFWWDPPCVAGKHLGGPAPPIFGDGNSWLIHPWLINMEGSIWVANDHLYHLLGYCTPIDKPWVDWLWVDISYYGKSPCLMGISTISGHFP